MSDKLTDLFTEREMITEEQAKLARDKRVNEEKTTEWLISHRCTDCFSINWSRVRHIVHQSNNI